MYGLIKQIENFASLLPPATPDQIAAMKVKGYIVEDLSTYGPEHVGFRWINTDSGAFQDDVESMSELGAWSRAIHYESENHENV